LDSSATFLLFNKRATNIVDETFILNLSVIVLEPLTSDVLFEYGIDGFSSGINCYPV
jgi:hypothetical protein